MLVHVGHLDASRNGRQWNSGLRVAAKMEYRSAFAA
jgi:hypothetical protein